MGEKEGEQMLGIPLHTVSWPLVTRAAPSEKCSTVNVCSYFFACVSVVDENNIY